MSSRDARLERICWMVLVECGHSTYDDGNMEEREAPREESGGGSGVSVGPQAELLAASNVSSSDPPAAASGLRPSFEANVH